MIGGEGDSMLASGEALKSRRKCRRPNRSSSDGSQLVEFALALPILLLLVVGIWDFGSAFALKQKLTNAAREADRIVVSTPISNPNGAAGCSKTVPCSIVSAATSAHQYLTNASLNASWITPSSPSSTAACPSGEWVYGNSGAPGPSLDIKSGVWISPAGNVVPASTAPPLGSVKATQATLIWPLKWQLASFLPGVLPTHISTTVTMANLGGGCGDSIQ